MSKSIGKYVYNEQDVLGQGAFGKVYKGINTQSNEEVAVKIQNTRNLRKEIAEALNNEISAMKRLQHPHLVNLHDVYELDDKKIIVMELCKTDLSETVRGGQLSESEMHEVLQQLIAGFKELMRLGLVHRDIKPSNCFERNGVYKLGDFGAIVEADYTNKILMKQQYGTMAYECPQMLTKEKYSTKCDVWSLGIMCYELLYGQPPWFCITEGQYIRAIKTWPLRFPLYKRVSIECKDFISKCLVYHEKTRMSWDELIQHPWLLKSEEKRTYGQSIELIDRQLTEQISETAQQNNFNPASAFRNYDIDNKGHLDLKKFEMFLVQFDPRITKKETLLLFSQFANNHQLSLDSFQNIFKQ